MHGLSELVGYHVRLIPLTSEFPSRFRVINAIASNHGQYGTSTKMLDVGDYNRSVMPFDALGRT